MKSVAGLAIIQELDTIALSEPGPALVTICKILSRIVTRLEGITDSEQSLRLLVTEVSVKVHAADRDLSICVSHLNEAQSALQGKLDDQVNRLQSQLDNFHSILHLATHPTDAAHLVSDSPPDWRAAHDWFCHHEDILPNPSTPPFSCLLYTSDAADE